MIINVVTQLIFFVFAFSAIAAALVTITARNPVKGVLFLVLTFVAMAGVWILLHAEFLALILVVVYVGAVMTLFLFVVMMLNIDTTVLRRGFVKYLPVGLVMVLLMLLMLFLVVAPVHFGLNQYPAPAAEPDTFSNVKALGDTLYSRYIYPFEVAGVLLLVAMISAITLAYRGQRNRKRVDINKQLNTQAKDRVSLIQLKSEGESNT